MGRKKGAVKVQTTAKKDNRIKLLVIGDMIAPTGFSRVIHNILKNLTPAKFEITGVGVNYDGSPHNYDLRVFPATSLGYPGDVYGLMRSQALISQNKFDLIFILNDAWIQQNYLGMIKDIFKDNPNDMPKIVTYTPVDAEDHDPAWYKDFDIVQKVIAYTEFGRKEIQKASGRDDILVIPHGIDSRTFFKMNGDKKLIKQTLLPKREEFWSDGSFVILNANRNQPRKRLDIAFEAFKLFAEGKPDNVMYYHHAGLTDQHIDAVRLAIRLGINNRFIVTGRNSGIQTVSDEFLNLIYNSCDVGINTGVGEGFSLTNIEHAITGAPQVVASHSALRELYIDCGILVPTTMPFVLDNIMTTGYLVRPEDVASKLEILYRNKTVYDQLSQKGIAKFSDPKYQWSNIGKLFEQVFEEAVNGK